MSIGGTLCRDIPTVGSIMAFFNKELVYACKDEYVSQMEKLSLPVDVQKLEEWHRTASNAAYAHFDQQKFGNEVLSMSGTLRDTLQEAIDKEYTCVSTAARCQLTSSKHCRHCRMPFQIALRSRATANVYASSVICEKLEMACEDLLEIEGRMRLPSMGRFRYVSPSLIIMTSVRR